MPPPESAFADADLRPPAKGTPFGERTHDGAGVNRSATSSASAQSMQIPPQWQDGHGPRSLCRGSATTRCSTGSPRKEWARGASRRGTEPTAERGTPPSCGLRRTWAATYLYARNRYLTDPNILHQRATLHRELAADQARELGLLDPSGPGFADASRRTSTSKTRPSSSPTEPTLPDRYANATVTVRLHATTMTSPASSTSSASPSPCSLALDRQRRRRDQAIAA